jgi:hypothetical protein
MADRKSREQAGETGHAEGQHGSKTHEAFLDQVESGDRDATAGDADTPMRSSEGRHRLREDREQHDEADKNSEANRKRAEVEKGRLDPDLPGVGDRINGDPY